MTEQEIKDLAKRVKEAKMYKRKREYETAKRVSKKENK
jgi:uncharacterized protein YerC